MGEAISPGSPAAPDGSQATRRETTRRLIWETRTRTGHFPNTQQHHPVLDHDGRTAGFPRGPGQYHPVELSVSPATRRETTRDHDGRQGLAVSRRLPAAPSSSQATRKETIAEYDGRQGLAIPGRPAAPPDLAQN